MTEVIGIKKTHRPTDQIVSHENFFLHEEVKNFQAGNISKHVKAWEKIATDSYILDTVKSGIKMDFLTARDSGIIQGEICKLLGEGVIIPTERR